MVSQLIHRRMLSQHLVGARFVNPVDVVAWFGAVQAQDYAGAKWALGQRLRTTTDATLDQDLADGVIVRTHVLRPTWHFVAPADIRWMLRLTAPHVNAQNSYQYRRLELDEVIFGQSETALTQALRDGRSLTRDELSAVLSQAGIPIDG